jgi:hypothetical protein
MSTDSGTGEDPGTPAEEKPRAAGRLPSAASDATMGAVPGPESATPAGQEAASQEAASEEPGEAPPSA